MIHVPYVYNNRPGWSVCPLKSNQVDINHAKISSKKSMHAHGVLLILSTSRYLQLNIFIQPFIPCFLPSFESTHPSMESSIYIFYIVCVICLYLSEMMWKRWSRGISFGLVCCGSVLSQPRGFMVVDGILFRNSWNSHWLGSAESPNIDFCF